jgi:hypothetical protein
MMILCSRHCMRGSTHCSTQPGHTFPAVRVGRTLRWAMETVLGTAGLVSTSLHTRRCTAQHSLHGRTTKGVCVETMLETVLGPREVWGVLPACLHASLFTLLSTACTGHTTKAVYVEGNAGQSLEGCARCSAASVHARRFTLLSSLHGRTTRNIVCGGQCWKAVCWGCAKCSAFAGTRALHTRRVRTAPAQPAQTHYHQQAVYVEGNAGASAKNCNDDAVVPAAACMHTRACVTLLQHSLHGRKAVYVEGNAGAVGLRECSSCSAMRVRSAPMQCTCTQPGGLLCWSLLLQRAHLIIHTNARSGGGERSP